MGLKPTYCSGDVERKLMHRPLVVDPHGTLIIRTPQSDIVFQQDWLANSEVAPTAEPSEILAESLMIPPISTSEGPSSGPEEGPASAKANPRRQEKSSVAVFRFLRQVMSKFSRSKA